MKTGRPRVVPQMDYEPIKVAYLNGATLAAIAVVYDCSIQTVCNVLTAQAVKRRPQGRPRTRLVKPTRTLDIDSLPDA